MNAKQKIEQLKKEVSQLEKQIANCHHEYAKAIYDPEQVRESYGYKIVGQGSDVWSEPEGYRDVTKERWSRECIHCGKKQYTYDQEPIVTGYKPKF